MQHIDAAHVTGKQGGKTRPQGSTLQSVVLLQRAIVVSWCSIVQYSALSPMCHARIPIWVQGERCGPSLASFQGTESSPLLRALVVLETLALDSPLAAEYLVRTRRVPGECGPVVY